MYMDSDYKLAKYSYKLSLDPSNPIYKSKYNHYLTTQQGGTYEFSDIEHIPEFDSDARQNKRKIIEAHNKLLERCKQSMVKIQLGGLKYIAGPIDLQILSNEDKHIMLFGESHYVSPDYMCGSDDADTTLHFTEFMYYLLNKFPTKTFDLFVEDELRSDRQSLYNSKPKKIGSGSGSSGSLQNISYLFSSCRSDLKDRSICQKEFPNLRYHLFDMRERFSKKEDIIYRVIDAADFLFFEPFRQDIIDKKDDETPKYIDFVEKRIALIFDHILKDSNKWFDMIFDIPEIKKQYKKVSDPKFKNMINEVRVYYTRQVTREFTTKYPSYLNYLNDVKKGSLSDRYYMAGEAGLIFCAVIPDIYAIGRMFKKFTKRSKYKGELHSDHAKNIIVYAGYYHANSIADFLLNSGYGFESKLNVKKEQGAECVKVDSNFMDMIGAGLK